MWSISELAQAAGVSTRTLRHYQALGLLLPAGLGPGDRRRYGEAEALRLQQIRLLTSFGLSLERIGQVLAAELDLRAALSAQAAKLALERGRIDRMHQAVVRTLARLEEGDELILSELFDGFSHDPYEAEARQRWGDAAVDASRERIRSLTPPDAQRARDAFSELHLELRALSSDGVGPTDPRLQNLVARHYELTSLFWTPDAAAYRGLGQMYVEDSRFRANIGGGDDAAVALLRDAMNVYVGFT